MHTYAQPTPDRPPTSQPAAKLSQLQGSRRGRGDDVTRGGRGRAQNSQTLSRQVGTGTIHVPAAGTAQH